MLQFAVHGKSLYGVGLAHESALMYLQCVSTGALCIFKYQHDIDAQRPGCVAMLDVLPTPGSNIVKGGV